MSLTGSRIGDYKYSSFTSEPFLELIWVSVRSDRSVISVLERMQCRSSRFLGHHYLHCQNSGRSNQKQYNIISIPVSSDDEIDALKYSKIREQAKRSI